MSDVTIFSTTNYVPRYEYTPDTSLTYLLATCIYLRFSFFFGLPPLSHSL